MPLHRTTAALALLLAGTSAITATIGFRWVAANPDAGSATTEQISDSAAGNLVLTLFWVIGGLLLAQQVRYGRVIVFVLAVAFLSQYAEPGGLTPPGNQLGSLIPLAGLVLGSLFVVLLLVSAAATRTRRPRSGQVPRGVGGQPQMGGYAYGPATPGRRVPPPPGYPYH
ncbi:MULTISPECIES: hypothetical protein [unclassified Nocardia]|uniref:hypothetical protein n=1 Tax=unclassified Nocardia TaxID=2637762 RepID=UPI0033A7F19F